MIVWLNGALLDSAAARIDPADRGFLLGDGVFETITVRGGKILRLAAHERRLREGCDVLRLPRPEYDLGAVIAATVTANALADAIVRVTLTRGIGARGVMPPENPAPTLLVSVTSLPQQQTPARCVIAAVTRRNEHSPLSRIKSLNYLDGILARQEAQERGADDALLLNGAGRVSEATSSNLFIVKGGRVMTPPVADGALPGIMRAEILAATGGIEKSLSPDDVTQADEAFLTNSLDLRRIASVEGNIVGTGSSFPTFDLLMSMIGKSCR